MEDLLKQLRNILQMQFQNEETWATTIHDEQQKIRKIFFLQNDQDPFEPFYFPNSTPSPIYPEVYNERGERMRFFFLRDRDIKSNPYEGCERFIIWDRYNFGLENHVYCNEEIFKPIGNPKRRFGIVTVPRSIRPNVYDEILNRKDWIEQKFDLIFTSDSEVLEKISNARRVLFDDNSQNPFDFMFEKYLQQYFSE